MATKETCELDAAHPPKPKAVESFEAVLPQIKAELVASRSRWDKHEPRMYSRVHGISNVALTNFTASDLVLVRHGVTAYGHIIFGKFRLHCLDDAYLHVRIWTDSEGDVKFHSIYTEEGDKDEDEQPHSFRAIMTEKDPLEWFDE
ncbi:hypothetical protein BZG36_01305 [Bifiguratus adelaidae]|uniref:Uncharacterized protein n=1 Tax=Bifiguratus adelaidae TaxID=1938954 RepID=A0A261Y5A1_9FUNG|nr:hypothetical protein BZG36_01305 [Bifiguratus adelaidae]